MHNSSINQLLEYAEKHHWWFQARRKIVEYLFFKKNILKKIKILSVGCGTGMELEFLSNYGDITAVDIDPEVVKLAKAKGFDVICADITQGVEGYDQHFDVIVAMDILEHTQDDFKVVKVLKNLLCNDGILIFTVPALPSLWSCFDEVGDFPHFRRYTKKSLKDLFIKQNFYIEKISYYNFFLFPFAYYARKKNVSFEDQLLIKSKFENIVLYYIFSFERFFLKYISFPIGVSLIGYVKKDNYN